MGGGIERFFSSLNREFDVVTDLKKPYQKIDCTHFMIDFNSIIHTVSSKMLSQINDYKSGKLKSIPFEFNTIQDFEPALITMIKTNIKNMLKDNLISENINFIVLAIDGVPSFAK